jgi:RND family efflux transporter MFP subunit
MPRIPPALAFCLLTAAAAGCGEGEAPPPAPRGEAASALLQPAPPPATPTPVSSRPARKGWIGVVVARETVDVTAGSTGRLLSVAVEIGDRVRRGDPIASLDTSLIAQDLEMARSSLRASEADQKRVADELAEARARNERRQGNPDFFSKEDLAEAALQAKTAEAAYEVAQARVAEQRARVRQLEAGVAQNVIRAPFDGRVAERFADQGALVGPGTPVVRLISAGELLVRAAVPPEEARTLAAGTPVTATVRTLGLRVAGIIERVAPEVDAASQMVLIEIRLSPTPEAEDRIQTGLVVDVRRG